MGTPPLRRELAEEAVERVNAQLRAGFVPRGFGSGKSAVEAAGRQAIEDGFVSTLSAFQSRLRAAHNHYRLEPDETLYRPARYQQPVAKFQLLPASPPTPPIFTGRRRRILVIPDRHRDPRHPHRLEWDTIIWRFGSEQRFDDVVDLGDDLTLDSCSRHDRNDTLSGRIKPSIRADLDHQLELCQAEERGRAKDWKPRKYKLRGNHNHRLWLFENNHPETDGALTGQYLQTWAQFGWREYGFGEILTIDGIGFTHAPFNGMGKPMSGKTATHRAGALLTASLVHGHTHSFEVHHAAKLGMIDKVSVIQAGCALPPGEVEHYATHNPTGWSYGVLDLTIEDGEILDLAFHSLKRLRSTYSDDGADVRAA